MVDTILGQTRAQWQLLTADYVTRGNTLPVAHKLEDALALSVWRDINCGGSRQVAIPVTCINWVDALFSNYTAEVTQR